jgi:hypothetical protein
MPILGIIASQNYPRITSSYESIATTVLGSSQSSVTFTDGGAWSGYKHLQIRVFARGTVSDDQDAGYLRFNSDTGSNYSMHYITGSGGGASALAAANSAPGYPMYMFFMPANNAASGAFGSGICDILDFSSTTKTKVARSFTGADRNSAGRLYFQSVLWNSTSAITSITIVPMNGSFATNSHFALYGIKD